MLLILLYSSSACANPRIAIIIDDIGYSITDIEKLEDMDLPITTAIFPGYDYSAALAEQSYNLGFEVIVHMPMESIKKLNPGPGAIYHNMTDAQIKKVLNDNIKSVPYSIGINNHMGSKVTTDARCMQVIMSEVKRNGMLFIDSLVASGSVCRNMARRLEMSELKRNVFLDNVDDPDYIAGQLKHLVKIAKMNGRAIGIGHVNRVHTMPVIKKMADKIKAEGVKFCYVSELV